MAKTSQIIRNKKETKFSTRQYTRCERCGRPHSIQFIGSLAYAENVCVN